MNMQVQLLGTQGCHLCEQAHALLQSFVFEGLQVELVDIMDDPVWLNAYALSIPVLRRVDSNTELAWPFSVLQIAHFLEK